MIQSVEEMVNSWACVRSEYEKFGSALKNMIDVILTEAEVTRMPLEMRAKDVDHLKEKIERKRRDGSIYTQLTDITDLIGIRIVTYDKLGVDTVISILRGLFVIQEENDPRNDPAQADRFGYQSIHMIVQVDATRAEQEEWRPFADFKAEIQVRTVAQHAWATVSHRAAYNHEKLPLKVQRRLAKVSALFEAADDELVQFDSDYQQHYLRGRELHWVEGDALLDYYTLDKALQGHAMIRKLLTLLESKNITWTVRDEEEQAKLRARYESLGQVCRDNGVSTVNELRTWLDKEEDRISFVTGRYRFGTADMRVGPAEALIVAFLAIVGTITAQRKFEALHDESLWNQYRLIVELLAERDRRQNMEELAMIAASQSRQ